MSSQDQTVAYMRRCWKTLSPIPVTLLLLLCALLPQPCQAHSWETMDLDVEVDGLEWKAEVHFDAGYAVPQWRNDNSVSPPKLEWLKSLSAAEQAGLRTEAERYLREYLRFTFNGSSVRSSYEFPDWADDPPRFPPHYDNNAFFRVVISGQLEDGIGVFTLNTAEGVYPQISCVVNSEERYLLTSGDAAELVRRTAERQTETIQLSTNQRILNDLSYGFRHVIPHGLDHILFIVAMSLVSLNFRTLLKLTLTFTVAHSVTLALVSTGVISLTPFLTGLIELFIAFSIVMLAAHSLRSNTSQPNTRQQNATLLIFTFGLIHGMGFASALREGLSDPDGFWLRLLFTNVGIEIAQILLILVTLAVFSKIKSAYPRTITSVVILVIALIWTVDRTINLGSV